MVGLPSPRILSPRCWTRAAGLTCGLAGLATLGCVERALACEGCAGAGDELDVDGSGSVDSGDGGPSASGSAGESWWSDGDDDGLECELLVLRPTYRPPQVMFVVDASASMHTWAIMDGGSSVVRLSAVYDAVASRLTTHQHGVAFGLQSFPTAKFNAQHPITSCTVAGPPLAPALGNIEELKAAMPGQSGQDLHAKTPMTAALALAVAELAKAPPGLPKAIVLFADDAPNCPAHLLETESDPFKWWAASDMEAAVAQLDAASEAGIVTYVLRVGDVENTLGDGAQGVDPQVELSRLAIAGGAARGDGDPYTLNSPEYFPGGDAQEVVASLRAIASSLPCVFELPVPPSQFQLEHELIWVSAGDTPLDRVGACQPGQDGWTWWAKPTHLEICGPSCDVVKQRVLPITVEYDCPHLE